MNAQFICDFSQKSIRWNELSPTAVTKIKNRIIDGRILTENISYPLIQCNTQ